MARTAPAWLGVRRQAVLHLALLIVPFFFLPMTVRPGLVAGLVGITPAAGFVDPMGALVIGLISGPVCYFSAVWVKKLLGYDDSLDAFGIHGVGGAAGALMTGVLATAIVNPAGKDHSIFPQLWDVAWTFGWSAGVTLLVLIVCRFTTGVRVSPEAEVAGLDHHLHGEALEA